MKKLHYHSDCPFFAGCENMLANFLQDDLLNSKYDISFSYRYSEIYKSGLKKRVEQDINEFPVSLICEYDWIGKLSFIFKILYILIPIKYLIFIFNFIKMRNVLKKIRPDIIHINNGGYPAASSASATVFAAKSLGINNVLYVVNNIATPYSKPIRWFDIPIDFFVKKYVTFFITGSMFAGEKLIGTLKLPRAKWIKVFNGIFRRKIWKSKPETLDRLKVSEDRFILGTVALFDERKGHEILINAFKDILNEEFDKKPILLLEGHGPVLNDMKSLVDKLGVSDDIKFIGDEEYIFDFINCLDVLVLPSIRNEDFPNVILEAMSLGKAVVGTDIAGIPEQIENNITGFVVEANNVDAIGVAIKRLLGDYNLIKTMGDAGRKRFERKFTLESSMKNYYKIYESMEQR